MAALDSFTVQCLSEVSRRVDLWIKVDGETAPPTAVLNVICINNCSEHGTCSQGNQLGVNHTIILVCVCQCMYVCLWCMCAHRLLSECESFRDALNVCLLECVFSTENIFVIYMCVYVHSDCIYICTWVYVSTWVDVFLEGVGLSLCNVDFCL